MHAFVTGSTGFIGTNLVKELIKRQYSIGCLVRTDSDRSYLQHECIEIVEGDLLSPGSLAEQIRKADIVFHVAGVTKAVNRGDYFRGNLETTLQLVELIKRCGPAHQKLIYVSSQAAAGPCAAPAGIDETNLDCPAVSAYGRSKYEAEQEVFSIASYFPVVVLRPSIVFGPHDHGMMPLFKSVSRGLRIKSGHRDFPVSLIYVGDLVEAILLAATSATAERQMFYVSDGKSYKWDTLNAAIARHLNPKAVTLPIPLTFIWLASRINGLLGQLLERPQDLNPDKWFEIKQAGWVCNSDRIQAELGFQPRWKLEDAIEATVAWYRKSGWL